MELKGMLALLQPSAKTKGKKTLHFYSGLKLVESLSIEDLRAQSADRVSFIQQSFQNEQFVHLSMKNSPEFLKCLFAIWMAGKTPVPLPVRDYVSNDYFKLLLSSAAQVTGSKKVLVEADFRAVKLENIEFVVSKTSPLPAEVSQPSDLALLQFSSGSTQKPKAVMLTAEKILKNISMIGQGVAATENDVLTTWLPFYHDMGLIGGILGTLFVKNEIHVHNPGDFLADSKLWLEQAANHGTTVLMGPNLLYKKIMDVSPLIENLNLKSVRVAFIGAEPVDAQILKEFSARMKQYGFSERALFPVYGLAENVLAVTFPKLNSQIEYHEQSARQWVSCGFPLEGIELRIEDEQGNECKPGQIGRILIHSPSQTSGYFTNSQATEELFDKKGALKTGDLGFFLPEKGLFITGREKELIVQNGRKWFPVDLEWTLKESGFRGMGRSAIISDSLEQVSVIFETKLWSPFARRKLEKQTRTLLQNKFLLKIHNVLAVPPCALPRTSSGKMKRLETLQLLNQGKMQKQRSGYFVHRIQNQMDLLSKAFFYLVGLKKKSPHEHAARDLLVDHLIESLRSILRHPQKVTAKTSFMDLNIDSIQVIELNLKLKNNFTEIPLEKFIHLQSVQNLADFLWQNQRSEVLAWAEKSQNAEGK